MNDFTPRAQQALALARKEADRLHHNYVGTEHLLLGLISLGQGTAVAVLQKMGLDLETLRMEVEKMVGKGPDQQNFAHIPYTPRVKNVLVLAGKEAQSLNHKYFGTEHILLGLLREGEGVAARVLKNLNVDVEQTRREILKELDPDRATGAAETIHVPPKTGPSVAPMLRPDAVDASKRYDVTCNAGRREVFVVYQNVLFKSVKKLFPTREHDYMADFVELEQSDGETVFVSRYSIVTFCEHSQSSGAESDRP